MYTRSWSTSEREHDVVVDRDVKVAMPDGTHLDGDIYRPAGDGKYPVILGISPYSKELQSPPMKPIGFSPIRGYMESGDPMFFARRGYVHAVFNVRGCGQSEGLFQFNGNVEIQDVADLIAWLAEQPWSDGGVATFGVSYFAKLATSVATLHPPALKAIFAPFACNDWYRDVWYHGGILAARFLSHWRFSPDNLRYESLVKAELGEEGFAQELAALRADRDLMAIASLREPILDPDPPRNAILVDFLIKKHDGPFWQERNPPTDECDVPAYLGACWGNYALHLRGTFPSWEAWRGPKRLVVGPGVYLDRPLYQYQQEAVRWFDHWMKGVENGIMDEAPVRAFMPPSGQWREYESWPPPAARWTTFFLHSEGMLSEREHFPGEGLDSFHESPFEHGGVTYTTPPLVEETEICGPSVLKLFFSTTDTEALLHATLLLVDREGAEHELTRGWMRASRRGLDEALSTRWEPVLDHTKSVPLVPGEVYEVRIPIVATGRTLQPGERLALRIKGADDEPQQTSLQGLARAHVQHVTPARITIHHDEERPSALELPITAGNLMGTYFSGGDISTFQVVGS